MSDTNQVIDNSDLDLTGVPLRDPVIDKQRIKCTIKDLRWEQLTSTKTPDGKAKQLVIELVTEDPATSTDGQPVAPGHKFSVNIYATPTGGLTQEMINKKIGRFQVAALDLTAPGKFGPAEQYIGRPVIAWCEAEENKGNVYQRVGRWEAVK